MNRRRYILNFSVKSDVLILYTFPEIFYISDYIIHKINYLSMDFLMFLQKIYNFKLVLLKKKSSRNPGLSSADSLSTAILADER